MMKILFSLSLAIILFGGTVSDAYSQNVEPSASQQMFFHSKAIVAHIDDFDNQKFSLDQHIEEAEFVFEDEIVNRKTLYKYHSN